MQDEELREAIEISLTLRKSNHTKLSFEQTRGLYGRLFFAIVKKGRESQEERDKAMDAYLQTQEKILMRLPQEILDTVEDLKELALGYMSKETKGLLEAYYKELQ